MSDRYQIISAISSSRAGTLHRGWDKHQNRDVSIQRIAVTGEAAQEVLREARGLYGLRHPNVVTVHEYGEDAEGVYVVREMIKGKPLDAIVSQRPLSEQEFELLVQQALTALHEAHTRGLIHRNLQPATLMVPWNAQNTFGIKITDFTLGAPPDPSAPPSLESEHFMAPEQFGNSPVTLRTDLYSLGAVLYYCLTQQHAFKGAHSSEVVVAHLYHQFTPLQELRPDLSKPFCAWVERLMKFHAAERPASAEEALQMFKLIPKDDVAVAAPLIEDEPAAVPLFEPEEAAAMPEPVWEEAAPDMAEAEIPEEAVPAPVPEDISEETAAPAVAAESFDEEIAAQPEVLQTPEPAPPSPSPRPARRVAAAQESSPQPPPRHTTHKPKSAMSLIIMAFVVILFGMLGLVSYLKYSSRGDRERRLTELQNTPDAQVSDLDVQMLLEFLDEPAKREAAGEVLAKLPGGQYVDGAVVEQLEKTRAYAAKVQLVKIIGQRRIRSGVAAVLPYTLNQSEEMTQAAWITLGAIADHNDLPRLIERVNESLPRDTEVIENALVAVVEGATDRDAATKAIRQGYDAAMKNAAGRAMLLQVITRVGGGAEGLAVVTSAISDPNEDVRQEAIKLLAKKYPTHDPLAAIAARFPEEPSEAGRMYLLLAAKALVEKPGASSQETLAKQVQSLYANAKTEDERDRALETIAKVVAPSTATFYQEYAARVDPSVRRQALSMSATYQDMLKRVVAIEPGSATTPVPAENADFTLGSSIGLEEGILSHWKEPSEWAAWLLQFPANGTYEVMIYQAQAGDATGTYEVHLAGQTKVTAVVKTAGADDFKGFVVGEFTIAHPGLYKLLIRPRKIPEGGELFRVQKLAVKPL